MAPAQTLVHVTESSQVGDARRSAARVAALSGLNETGRGKVAIIATELANNLVRHATGGDILISLLQTATLDGVEILAIDRGPGMADVGRCMQDGFSTGGTAGVGFGAIRRLSTEFDVFSSQPAGTVAVSRILTEKNPLPPQTQWGVICLPAPGETACGDNWSIAEKDGRFSMMLADGLGHGPLAAKAADEAVRVFEANPYRAPGLILDAAHIALRSSRGAAMAVVEGNMECRAIKYAGVGNISGSLIDGEESRRLFSHNGTIGLQIRKIQEFDYPWSRKALLVMHSDGVQTRWHLADYPGLSERHPSVIAGVLYRDFSRQRDDLTVAVVR